MLVHSYLIVLFAISFIAWIIATIYAFVKKEALMANEDLKVITKAKQL